MGFTLYNSTGAAQLNAVADLPVGTISQTVLSVAPAGWLMCDGNAVSRTAYAELFAAIGTTYGHGDGSTTFNVPDFRGRVPVGAGTGQGGRDTATPLTGTGKLVPATPLTSKVLGQWGGQELHQLSTAAMPSHNHAPGSGLAFSTNSTVGYYYNTTNFDGARENTTATTANTGGNNQHGIMQPFLVVNYIILATSLSKRVATSMPPQYVTALPGNPVDGQEVYYVASSANGVVWHLRYNASSSSAYKWEFIGGSPITATAGSRAWATRQTYSSLTYGDLSTVGPSITNPLAGDYLCQFKVNCVTNTTSGNVRVWVTGDSSFTWDGDTDLQMFQGNHTGGGFVTRTAVAANSTIKLQYAVSNAGTNAEFWNRQLAITPVRVG